MRQLTHFLVLLLISVCFISKAQTLCDSANSPAFKIRLAALNPASNGTCGVLISVDSLTSNPPGAPVTYTVLVPNQPTIIINPIPIVTLAINSGVYTVVAVQYTNMCTTTKTIQITIPQAPTISVSPSLTPICSAQANFLLASGATSYTWHTGANSSSIITNPSSVLNYTLKGATVNGCEAKVQGSFAAQASPTITPVPNQFSVCINQNIQFTAQGASTYTWNNGVIGNQFNSTPFSALGASTYTFMLKGTNAAGCTSTIYYSQIFYVEPCDVGLDHSFDLGPKQLVMYPNPAEDFICLKNIDRSTITGITISNYMGQTLSATSFEKQLNGQNISTKDLPSGLYTIRVASTQGNYIANFCKR